MFLFQTLSYASDLNLRPRITGRNLKQPKLEQPVASNEYLILYDYAGSSQSANNKPVEFQPIISSLKENQEIRVCILNKRSQIKVGCTSAFEISLLPSGNKIFEGYFMPTETISIVKDTGEILFRNQHLKADGLYISTKKQGTVTINGIMYRGDMKIMVDKNSGHMNVINILALSDYLQGVLCEEISPQWNIEAIKAQAIASRTFALYKMQKSIKDDFDVTDDVFSQVYGGLTTEDPRTNKAIQETEGFVLTYNGSLFPAFFHSTCGGNTEDVNEIWPMNYPCLKQIKCDFCKNSKNYSWTDVLKLLDIGNKIKKNMSDKKITSDIRDIRILSYNQSGRIKELEIIYDNNQKIKMTGHEFRMAVGPDIIKSTNFTVAVKNRLAYFQGYGWGHGIGLCQWGAKYLAETKNMSAKEILAYYYPGTKLEKK